MTTTFTTDLTHALAAITAAVDAGDDSPLTDGVWADLLEETGDSRAAGLRRAVAYAQAHADAASGWGKASSGYGWRQTASNSWTGAVEPRIFDRLPEPEEPGFRHIWNDVDMVIYPTKTAAFLALAAALTPETAHATD